MKNSCRAPRNRRFRFRFEQLEDRLVLAQLTATSSARYQDDLVTGQPSTDPLLAQSAANVLSAEALSRAEVDFLEARAIADGAQSDPNARSHFAQANASAASDTQWVVRGAPVGTPVDVVISLDATGRVRVVDSQAAIGAQRDARARVQMIRNNQWLIDSSAELSVDGLQLDNGWASVQNVADDYEVSYSAAVTLNVLVGELFQLDVRLDAMAIVDPLRNQLAVTEFSNGYGLGISVEPQLAGTTVSEFPVPNDGDGDGVPDLTEDRGPNGGDADRDGVADRLQATVATLPDLNGNYFTLRLENATGTGPGGRERKIRVCWSEFKSESDNSTT